MYLLPNLHLLEEYDSGSCLLGVLMRGVWKKGCFFEKKMFINKLAKSSIFQKLNQTTSPLLQSGSKLQQIRNFSLHEYQSQELFAKNGVTVPKGYACTTAEEAEEAARKIGG